jgi:hypothetical protein
MENQVSTMFIQEAWVCVNWGVDLGFDASHSSTAGCLCAA